MIESRFRAGVFNRIILSLGMMFFIFVYASISLAGDGTAGWIGIGIIFIVIAFFFVLIVRGELRHKAVIVFIDYDRIRVRGYAGLGKEKTYLRDEISGYQTCVLWSQSGDYEYLFLLIGKKRVIRLSEFYHENYEELKNNLKEKYKNHGSLKLNFWREFWDEFKS